MQGKIIKGIAGFYYVHTNLGLVECKAKGIFRKEQIKPLVGDDVEIDLLDEAEKKGNIRTLLPRSSQLIRPAVANVDQALVIFAITCPQPNFNLLDRFLVMMRQQGLPCIICLNKVDLEQEGGGRDGGTHVAHPHDGGGQPGALGDEHAQQQPDAPGQEDGLAGQQKMVPQQSEKPVPALPVEGKYGLYQIRHGV